MDTLSPWRVAKENHKDSPAGENSLAGSRSLGSRIPLYEPEKSAEPARQFTSARVTGVTVNKFKRKIFSNQVREYDPRIVAAVVNFFNRQASKKTLSEMQVQLSVKAKNHASKILNDLATRGHI